MEIVWYGLNAFRLAERGMASVVTDPYDSSVGLKPPRLRADIVTISHDAPECNRPRAGRGSIHVLDTPGEYEIGDVFITGIATYADKKRGAARGLNTIFHFGYNGLAICHLGHLGHVPTQTQIEALGAVDVLLTPVGGSGGLTPSAASEVVSLLEPSIVIPMRYKIPGLTLTLGTLNRFLKQMGTEKIESQESLKISRGSLPGQTEIVVLKPRLE
jgi:L-ascorbate metabolism protein UlaG (beta-lactamase superfamily)